MDKIQRKKVRKELEALCMILNIRFTRMYIEKRSEGCTLVKLYNMQSPSKMGCAALVAKAKQLGAKDAGFKQQIGMHLNTWWSFYARFEPATAPKQQDLFKERRYPGDFAIPPADERH